MLVEFLYHSLKQTTQMKSTYRHLISSNTRKGVRLNKSVKREQVTTEQYDNIEDGVTVSNILIQDTAFKYILQFKCTQRSRSNTAKGILIIYDNVDYQHLTSYGRAGGYGYNKDIEILEKCSRDLGYSIKESGVLLDLLSLVLAIEDTESMEVIISES